MQCFIEFNQNFYLKNNRFFEKISFIMPQSLFFSRCKCTWAYFFGI